MEALFEKLTGKKKRAPGGTLVLYTTRHGSTMRYAEQIAQPMDALTKEAAYAKIKQAATYDAIVLGCCVYDDQIKGLDFFADHAQELADKRLVLFTCGLGDPAQPEVREKLDGQIRAALGEAADRIAVFHLRGGVRWRSLGLAERMKLSKLLAQMKQKPEAERTLLEQQMIDAEGGSIDFSDEADIRPIIHAARFGKEAEF